MADSVLEGFAADTEFMTIEELIVEMGWPPDYISVKGLWPYIKRMPGDEVTGIEIGTGRGDSAYLLLEKCPNIKKIVTIDSFKEYMDWNGLVPQGKQERFEVIARKNLEKFGDRVEVVKLEDLDINRFKPESVDFLFIDGDHSETAVLADLSNYYGFLKPKGIVALHDFNLGSVVEAVKTFRNNFSIRKPIQTSSNNLVFWIK